MAASQHPEEPSQAEIAAILGDGAELIELFLHRNPELRPEWKYYGPKHGWSLKLFRGKRNMCFVGAEPGAVAMGFVLGNRAFELLQNSEPRPEVKRVADSARQYPEGWGLRFILRDEADLDDVQQVLGIKQAR